MFPLVQHPAFNVFKAMTKTRNHGKYDKKAEENMGNVRSNVTLTQTLKSNIHKLSYSGYQLETS